MTNAITAADATSPSDASKAVSGALGANQQINQQQFLTLFIEQLKNQDPLSPLEPDQLTAQLAQFSSLEQLTGINTRLDGLAGSFKQSTTSAMLSLLGKEVSIDDGQLIVRSGATPPATYTLDAGAQQVTATIRDQDGKVVRVLDLGAQAAGAHQVVFDGKDADGRVLADGAYTLEVSALAPGAKVPTSASLQTFAMIDGVDLSGDPPTLLAGGVRIPLDKVGEVRTTPPATS